MDNAQKGQDMKTPNGSGCVVSDAQRRRLKPLDIVPTKEPAPPPPKKARQTVPRWVSNRMKARLRALFNSWDTEYEKCRFYIKASGLSRDGQRALFLTAAVHKEYTGWGSTQPVSEQGAVVFDMRTQEIVWEDMDLGEVYLDEDWNRDSIFGKGSFDVVMDSNGEYLLTGREDYGDLTLTNIATGSQRNLYEDENYQDYGLIFFCFLENARYVLSCHSCSTGHLVLLTDRITGREVFYFGERHSDGDMELRYINDDCFAVRIGEEECLWRIKWKYGAPEDPELRARFDGLLRAAEAAEDPVEGLGLVDEALELDGYENDPSALRLRARIGSSLCRVTPLRIVPTIELAPPKAADESMALPTWIPELIEQTEARVRERHAKGQEAVITWSGSTEVRGFSRDGRRALLKTTSTFVKRGPNSTLYLLYGAGYAEQRNPLGTLQL